MKPTLQVAFRIALALNRAEAGTPVGEVCRISGISKATFRRWKCKYSGLTSLEVNRLRRLEKENRELKIALANLFLEVAQLGGYPLGRRGIQALSAGRRPSGVSSH
jgi:putative transposase